MNNDNIIEEKIAEFKKKFDGIGEDGAFIKSVEELMWLRTALLEVEQAGYTRGEKEILEWVKLIMSYKHPNEVKRLIAERLTPTDNNKEDGKPLETALAEATSN